MFCDRPEQDQSQGKKKSALVPLKVCISAMIRQGWGRGTWLIVEFLARESANYCTEYVCQKSLKYRKFGTFPMNLCEANFW